MAEAQGDRLHLHAVTARPDRHAPRILTPQGELQPLHPVEPRPVAAPTPPRRRPHPVVPLAGKSLREQDALPDLEVCERHRDRKSTRLNSSHITISYAVFCLKKTTGQ